MQTVQLICKCVVSLVNNVPYNTRAVFDLDTFVCFASLVLIHLHFL